MTAFSYRYADVDDAQSLLAFARHNFIAAFADDNTPEDMQVYLDASMTIATQTAELSDPLTKLLLMEQDATLVAYASVRDRPTPPCIVADHAIELHRFYVDAQWHGTSVAKDLMQHTYRAACELDAAHLWLGVWEHNPRAIRFYEKQGFADVGSIDFRLGSSPQTDRVMMRSL